MKKIILAAFLTLSLSLISSPLIAAPAYAACPTADTATTPKDQVKVGIGATGSDCSGSGVGDFVSTIVSILSIVVGIAAIIVIVLSGLKYITSAGDSNKVGSAKNTLIYALIGLLIAALAQFLVHFVLNAASNPEFRQCSAAQPDISNTDPGCKTK